MMNVHTENQSSPPVTAALPCHPECSEGSGPGGAEILRFAQDDSWLRMTVGSGCQQAGQGSGEEGRS
jgi:hypothetical protein